MDNKGELRRNSGASDQSVDGVTGYITYKYLYINGLRGCLRGMGLRSKIGWSCYSVKKDSYP